MKKNYFFTIFAIFILVLPVFAGVSNNDIMPGKVFRKLSGQAINMDTKAIDANGPVSVFSVNVNPTYSCVIQNDTLLCDRRTYQFDIYIYQTGSTDLYLTTYQLSMAVLNVTTVLNGGTFTCSYIAGTSQIPGIVPNGVQNYKIGANYFARIAGPLPIPGSLIPSTGLRVGRFQITNTVDFGQASMNIIWHNTFPATTLVYAVVPPPPPGGTSTAITDMNTHTTSLTNPIFNMPLTIYDMTGGGNYCITGPGAIVGLSGSEVGVLYRLVKNGTPVGADIPGTGSPLSFGPQTTGTYTCIAYRDATCIQDTMNGSVATAIGPIVPVIAGNDTVCPGATGEIYTTASGSGITNYQWSVTGGSIVSGASTSAITVDWGSSTPAEVSVNYDDNGCTAASPTILPVSFKTASTAATSISATTNPICPGDLSGLSLNGGSLGTGASWKWYSSTCGGTFSGSGTNINVQPLATTDYFVRAEGSCNTTSCASIKINVNPSQPVSVVISANPAGPVCNGTNVTFTATPTNGGTNPSFQWKLNGSNAGTNSSVFASSTFVNGDIVECILSSNATCPSGNPATSNSVTMTVNPIPIISTIQNQYVCKGSSVTLYVSGASTYAWSPATGLSATTGASVDASPTTPITYTIVGSSLGCSDTTTINVAVKDLPVISTGPDNPMPTICSGNSIDIYATGGVSYTWSPASGLNSTDGTLVMASPATTTVYTVTGTNAVGCSNTANITVSVNQNPAISVVPLQSLNICSGGTVDLVASGGTNYTWSPSTGLSATTGNSVVASPNNTTQYTVTGQNAFGCSDTAIITVSVSPSINVSVSPNQTICAGDSATLTASGASTYTWSPATGLSATTGSTVKASPTTTKIYTVIGKSGACTSAASVTVTIAPSISVSVTPNQAICFGSSLLVTATGATSYVWSPSPGLSATTGATVIASPTITTTYNVTGTSGLCSNTASIIITVNPKPTVTVSPNQAVCPGNSTILTASGGVTYSWSPATGLSATIGSNVTATPPQTINYSVIGKIGLCSDTAFVTVSVNSKPDIIAVAEPGGHDSIGLCLGDSVKLYALGGNSYSWSPNTALSQTTGSPVLANPTSSITYTLSGTDNSGCTNTSDIKITVFSCQKGGITDNSTNVNIYPNPSNGAFTIELSGYKGKQAFYTLQNVSGQAILDDAWSVEENVSLRNIDVSGFAAGIYFLKVISDTDVKVVKVVLE